MNSRTAATLLAVLAVVASATASPRQSPVIFSDSGVLDDIGDGRGAFYVRYEDVPFERVVVTCWTAEPRETGGLFWEVHACRVKEQPVGIDIYIGPTEAGLHWRITVAYWPG